MSTGAVKTAPLAGVLKKAVGKALLNTPVSSKSKLMSELSPGVLMNLDSQDVGAVDQQPRVGGISHH